MVLDIQSKEVIDKISDELKVQPALDIPRRLSNIIQLVYNVNPARVATIVRSVTSSGTLFTAPAKSKHQSFFLTGAWVTVSNAANLNGPNDIKAKIGGVSRKIIACQISEGNVTIQANSNSQTFDPPIKIDVGADIIFTKNGAIQTVAGISGYITEDI